MSNEDKAVYINRQRERYYDIPKTPLQRLLESSEEGSVKINELKELHSQLDPIDLQIGLESKLKEFVNLLNRKSIVSAA